MNKLNKIEIFLKNPLKVINNGILSLSEKEFQDQLIKTYKKDQLPTIDIIDLFSDFEEELTTYSFLEGTSLLTDLILLKKFAEKFEDCNYLEVGSWRGESLANIAPNTKHCTTINLSSEEMKNMKFSKEFIEAHGYFSKKVNNLTEVLQNTHTYDFTQLKDKFDLIFIDGDHSFEGVLNDTRKTFDLRRDRSSIIVWHDYGYSPERVRYSTLKAILDGIPKQFHHNLYHISNTLCAVYMEDCEFTTTLTKFPSEPTKIFSVKVKWHRS